MNRIEAVIKRKKHYAVFPIVCADHCAHLLNKNFKSVATNGTILAEVLEYGYYLYRYDMVLIFSDPYVEAEAMGCNIEYAPYPKLTGDAKLMRKNFIKRAPLNFKNRTEAIIKAAELLKRKVDVPVFVSIKGPFTLASFLAQVEDFLTMLLTDEKKAKIYIDRALNFQATYLKKLLAIGVHIFIGDPMASASVVSPRIFKKFAFEPLKILIKQIKSVGMISGVHICGDTGPIIDLLDNLGADILSIEDITLKAKTLKMGGVSTLTMLNGNKVKIKRAIESALKEDFLILSTACDVAVNTPVDNIKTMVDIARQYEA